MSCKTLIAVKCKKERKELILTQKYVIVLRKTGSDKRAVRIFI